jgi:hypothetical protein
MKSADEIIEEMDEDDPEVSDVEAEMDAELEK